MKDLKIIKISKNIPTIGVDGEAKNPQCGEEDPLREV